MERGHWEGFWGGLHRAGNAGEGSGSTCARACKSVQGLVGTRMVQKWRGGSGKGFEGACTGLAGGGAVEALVQGRAKVCKGKWAPEWLRNGEGALGRVLRGLAQGWQCRRGQWEHLCKGVQKRARAGGHQNGSEMARRHRGRLGGGLHVTCAPQEATSLVQKRAKKGVQSSPSLTHHCGHP